MIHTHTHTPFVTTHILARFGWPPLRQVFHKRFPIRRLTATNTAIHMCIPRLSPALSQSQRAVARNPPLGFAFLISIRSIVLLLFWIGVGSPWSRPSHNPTRAVGASYLLGGGSEKSRAPLDRIQKKRAHPWTMKKNGAVSRSISGGPLAKSPSDSPHPTPPAATAPLLLLGGDIISSPHELATLARLKGLSGHYISPKELLLVGKTKKAKPLQ